MTLRPKRTIALVTVSQLANYLTPLITFPLLVRAFDIPVYGLWIEVNTLVSLTIVFTFTAIASALNVVVMRGEVERDRVYINALYLVVAVGLALSALMFLTAPVLNSLTARQPTGTLLFRIMSLNVVISGLLVLCPHVCRLQRRTAVSISFEILVSVLRIAAAVFALLNKDIMTFAVIFVISQSVVIVSLVIVTYRPVKPARPDWPIARQLLADAVNLSAVNQANWLVMYGDRLMLSILSVSTAVAVYSASYQLTLVLIALGAPYLYVLLPTLGERWKAGDVTGAQAVVRQSSRSILILLVPAVVGLALTGNSLLVILANEQFAQNSFLVGMIATGVGIDVLGNALQYIFYAQGRPEVLRRIYLRAAAVNILANLIAIPLFSYNGAGLTTLLTFLLIFVWLWRSTGTPFGVLFDVPVALKCLFASLIMGLWVVAVVSPSVTGLMLAVSGGALIYGALLVALRVVSLAELVAIPRAVIRRVTG